jgi:tRNA dimethylallyltransferase
MARASPVNRRLPLLALVGPTAAGKTEASLVLAERLGAEIVSVDSMVVYRGMDVGTAKPTPADRARVRHHLLDVAEPAEPFTAVRFQALAEAAVDDIGARGLRPLLVGGSGLYYRAVVDRLTFPGTDPATRRELEAEGATVGAEVLHRRLEAVDPAAARRIEPSNVRRTVRALEVAAVTGRPFSAFAGDWERYPPAAVRAAGVDVPRPILRARIEARVRTMWPALVAETEGLLRQGSGAFLTSSQAIGYAEAVAWLRGEATEDEAVARMIRRTKALARRQTAWFRRDPRIRWFTVGERGAIERVDDLVDHLREA